MLYLSLTAAAASLSQALGVPTAAVRPAPLLLPTATGLHPLRRRRLLDLAELPPLNRSAAATAAVQPPPRSVDDELVDVSRNTTLYGASGAPRPEDIVLAPESNLFFNSLLHRYSEVAPAQVAARLGNPGVPRAHGVALYNGDRLVRVPVDAQFYATTSFFSDEEGEFYGSARIVADGKGGYWGAVWEKAAIKVATSRPAVFFPDLVAFDDTFGGSAIDLFGGGYAIWYAAEGVAASQLLLGPGLRTLSLAQASAEELREALNDLATNSSIGLLAVPDSDTWRSPFESGDPVTVKKSGNRCQMVGFDNIETFACASRNNGSRVLLNALQGYPVLGPGTSPDSLRVQDLLQYNASEIAEFDSALRPFAAAMRGPSVDVPASMVADLNGLLIYGALPKLPALQSPAPAPRVAPSPSVSPGPEPTPTPAPASGSTAPVDQKSIRGLPPAPATLLLMAGLVHGLGGWEPRLL